MGDVLTEELPSSGSKSCDHDLVQVEDSSCPSGQMTLVCKKDGCGYSKRVEKPKLVEDKSDKKLLLG